MPWPLCYDLLYSSLTHSPAVASNQSSLHSLLGNTVTSLFVSGTCKICKDDIDEMRTLSIMLRTAGMKEKLVASSYAHQRAASNPIAKSKAQENPFAIEELFAEQFRSY